MMDKELEDLARRHPLPEEMEELVDVKLPLQSDELGDMDEALASYYSVYGFSC